MGPKLAFERPVRYCLKLLITLHLEWFVWSCICLLACVHSCLLSCTCCQCSSAAWFFNTCEWLFSDSHAWRSTVSSNRNRWGLLGFDTFKKAISNLVKARIRIFISWRSRNSIRWLLLWRNTLQSLDFLIFFQRIYNNLHVPHLCSECNHVVLNLGCLFNSNLSLSKLIFSNFICSFPI